MGSRFFRKEDRESEPATESTIQECKANLLKGQDSDNAARTLGDIAIEHKDQAALLTLWEAICETSDLRTIIDPCAYTVGRIIRESEDSMLEDIGFDIFNRSVTTGSEPIVDKFAYTAGEVALRAAKSSTRRRARKFVTIHASDDDPLVRRCYAYTKHRITQ